MSYLSGVAFGTDEVSANNYLDDVLLYEESDDYTSGIPVGRHYGGKDYHRDGSIYKPPLANTTLPRQEYVTIPRKLYDIWRLKNNNKQREGLTKSNNMTDPYKFLTQETFEMQDQTMFFWFIAVIVFITFIYSLATYSMVKYITNVQRYEEITSFLYTLQEMAKKGTV